MLQNKSRKSLCMKSIRIWSFSGLYSSTYFNIWISEPLKIYYFISFSKLLGRSVLRGLKKTVGLLWFFTNGWWTIFLITIYKPFVKPHFVNGNVTFNLKFNFVFHQKIVCIKMKFFIKDFFRTCEQIGEELRIWSRLLK